MAGKFAKALFVLAFTLGITNGKSYLPPYIEGVPSKGAVVAIDPPDMRNAPLFRIEHKVLSH